MALLVANLREVGLKFIAAEMDYSAPDCTALFQFWWTAQQSDGTEEEAAARQLSSQ